jgi:hypothetical protein
MLKKPNTFKQLSTFFHQNWWFTGVSNIIIIICFIMFYRELSFIKSDIRQKTDIAMANVIAITPDGRVRLLERELVDTDSDTFKNAIKRIIKTMTVSESDLTLGFDKDVIKKITTPKVLDEISEEFNLLGKEHFDSEQAYNIFLVLRTNATYTQLLNDRFEIRVELEVQKDFRDKVTARLTELVVTDVITVTGFIRPSVYSTPDNPLGIRFESVKLSIFTYRDYFSRFQNR